MLQMRRKKTKDCNILYLVIHNSTGKMSIYKEISPLADKIGVDRSTIYRNFKEDVYKWFKNGYEIHKITDVNIKTRRGGR